MRQGKSSRLRSENLLSTWESNCSSAVVGTTTHVTGDRTKSQYFDIAHTKCGYDHGYGNIQFQARLLHRQARKQEKSEQQKERRETPRKINRPRVPEPPKARDTLALENAPVHLRKCL